MNFLQLRKDHLKIQHDISFYPYQEEISNRIINALNRNLRLTRNATEADISKLTQYELAVEISRQAGKTTTAGYTVETIMSLMSEHYSIPIRIGIFAPQIGQAQLSYTIARNALRPVKGLMITNLALKAQVREEENAKKLVLPNGSSCVIAPLTTTSKIEGLALDLIIIDEAQDADDEIVKHSVWPMGKTTNAPRIYIGKSGTKICHFYRLSQGADSYKAPFPVVAAQRRKLYEETGDARHLIYEKSVQEDIDKYGLDADEIQREYFLKWQIGTGQFTTQEDLEKLGTDRSLTFHDNHSLAFAGIDTAKNPDSTVVTIIRWNEELKKKELINWLELRGDNYQTQFDVIHAFLKNYNVVSVAIDSTGQGDFMPDMFEAHTEWQDENTGLHRIKFSAVSKDMIYKNLKVTIKEFLTTLPKLDTKKVEKFKLQMLDLQQEYKGQLLSVHHPDDANAHDDYPDSWALAEWAYAKYNENKVEAETVTVDTGIERDIKYDSKGTITDYWPSDD